MVTAGGGWMLVSTQSGKTPLAASVPSDVIINNEGPNQQDQRLPDAMLQAFADQGSYQVMAEEAHGPDADVGLVMVYKMPVGKVLPLNGFRADVDMLEWHVGGGHYKLVQNSAISFGARVSGAGFQGIESPRRCTLKEDFNVTAGKFGSYATDSDEWETMGMGVQCATNFLDTKGDMDETNCRRLCAASTTCGYYTYNTVDRTCTTFPPRGCEPTVRTAPSSFMFRRGGGGTTQCTHEQFNLGLKHWVRRFVCPLDAYQARAGTFQCLQGAGAGAERPVTDNALTLVSEPHPLTTPPDTDLALQSNGAIPFATGSREDGCSVGVGGFGTTREMTGPHCYGNINDGLYGNLHSWQPGAATRDGKRFVGVRLGRPAWVAKVAVGRKPPNQSCCNDGWTGWFELQYTMDSQPDDETPDARWITVAEYRMFNASRHVFALKNKVWATAMRIIVPEATSCIDEFEIYGQPAKRKGAGTIRVVAASYGANCESDLRDNTRARLALLCNGKDKCEFKVDKDRLGNPAPRCHKEFSVTFACGDGDVRNVTLGKGCALSGGGDGLECQDASGKVAKLSCEPPPTMADCRCSYAFYGKPLPRDAVTEAAYCGTDNSAPPCAAGWDDLRCPYNMVLHCDKPVEKPEPPECLSPTPAPTPDVVSPNSLVAEGVEVLAHPPWNDVALASNGGVPFASGSGEGCTANTPGTGARVKDIGVHCFKNINDGKYGNDHSWSPGANLVHWNRFVGVRFESPVVVERIALGRTSDGVGCCNANYTGKFHVQYTMEPDASHATDPVHWFAVGSFQLTSFERHVFRLETPVWATAVRVIPPYEGNVLDELEVYGTRASRDFEDPSWHRDYKKRTDTELVAGRTELNGTFSLVFDARANSFTGPAMNLITIGGEVNECANSLYVFFRQPNDLSAMSSLCVSVSRRMTSAVCTSADFAPRVTYHVRVVVDMSPSKPSPEVVIFVDEFEAARDAIAKFDPTTPSDDHEDADVMDRFRTAEELAAAPPEFAVSYLSGCHNRPDKPLDGEIANVVISHVQRLETSVEAWNAQANRVCDPRDCNVLSGKSEEECKAVCVKSYGGCNDGFSYDPKTLTCAFPRTDKGCRLQDQDGGLFLTAIRGDPSDRVIEGYERRAGTRSSNGAGWLSLAYAGETATNCKSKCDVTPSCGFFVYRLASTKSLNPNNCWLYEATEYAKSSLVQEAGYETFVRKEGLVCRPEPLFAEVPQCFGTGEFDGVPTLRDKGTGLYSAVFSAERGDGGESTEESICAAMGMSYEGGVAQVSSQNHMRFVWYPLSASQFCAAEEHQFNEKGGKVMEKDNVNGLCLVGYQSVPLPFLDTFFSRLQCSCGDDSAIAADRHSLLLQTGAFASASAAGKRRPRKEGKEGEAETAPELWAWFGPSTIVAPGGVLARHATVATRPGASFRRWNAEDELGALDLDGKEGEVRVRLAGEDVGPKPLLARSAGHLTVTAWVNPTTVANCSGAGVQLKDADGMFGSALSLSHDGKYAWFVQDRQGKFRGPQSKAAAKPGVWTHLAGVFEEECMALYVNGSLADKVCDKRGFQTTPPAAHAPEILVGRYETDKHSSWLEGSMADVRVYLRSLGEDELAAVMRDPIANRVPSPQRK